MAEADFLNKQFNEWIVLNKSGTDLYRCKCDTCGFERDIRGYNLKNKPPKCKHNNKLRRNCGDLVGEKFGELVVIERLPDGFVKCLCSCGNSKTVHSRYLRDGKTTSCGHDKIGKTSKLIDIRGQKFGTWEVIDYYGDKLWACRCLSCGKEKNIRGHLLRGAKIPECACKGKNTELKGKKFGEWEVLWYNNSTKMCTCKCKCGKVKDVDLYTLENGLSKSCGHNTTGFKDLTGLIFGDWKVEKIADLQIQQGVTLWTCECLNCGTISDVSGYSLRSGKSRSCGCKTTGFKNLTEMDFGYLKAIEYIPEMVKWRCRCKCGKETFVTTYNLLNGKVKSCGCMADTIKKINYMEKHGVPNVAQINRSIEQINITSSKDSFKNYIESLGYKPTTSQLCELVGLKKSRLLTIVHKYDLDDYIDIGTFETSRYEDELNRLFPCEHRNTRSVLNGKEIDLYYPESKLGIEFNGSYWHSDIHKETMYHQKKTLEAAKLGIRIIHIFEYEWLNDDTKRKIISLIKRNMNHKDMRVIHGRKCDVRQINSNTANDFLNKYHLQNSVNSEVCIGCFYGNELIGVMAFRKPRFNKNYQYELTRLAWKDDIISVGGSDKMLKWFKDNYDPYSIITYCDISKFEGDSYRKLGFKEENLSRPNYKWVSLDNNDVKSRYQTQKQSLIEKGYGNIGDTEDDIMKNLGYLKVYDCGNLVYTWAKD